jgi:hypothetical protein
MTLIEHNDAISPAERTNLPSVEVVPPVDVLLAKFMVAHTAGLGKGMPDFKTAVVWLAMAKTAYRYTQRQMAEKTGVAQSTISQYLKWHRNGCPDDGPFVRRVPNPKQTKQTGQPPAETGKVIDEPKLINADEPKLINGPVSLIEDTTIITPTAEDLIAYVVKNAATKDVLRVVGEGLVRIADEPEPDDPGEAKDEVEASTEARKAENEKLDANTDEPAEVEEPNRRSRRRKG